MNALALAWGRAFTQLSKNYGDENKKVPSCTREHSQQQCSKHGTSFWDPFRDFFSHLSQMCNRYIYTEPDSHTIQALFCLCSSPASLCLCNLFDKCVGQWTEHRVSRLSCPTTPCCRQAVHYMIFNVLYANWVFQGREWSHSNHKTLLSGKCNPTLPTLNNCSHEFYWHPIESICGITNEKKQNPDICPLCTLWLYESLFYILLVTILFPLSCCIHQAGECSSSSSP